MSNTARKTRKRIRHAALAAGETATAEAHAFEKDPKRPTRAYTTRKEQQEKRRADREAARALESGLTKLVGAAGNRTP